MKKLFVLLIAATVMTSHPAKSQVINPKSEIFTVGTLVDTAFGNSTKTQTAAATTKGGGITVQYTIQQLNDSCAGYVSVWCSIDNVHYFPYPGADSVAISVGVNFTKGWFLATAANKNPIKSIQVRTRLTSTYTVGKATVKTKYYPY